MNFQILTLAPNLVNTSYIPCWHFSLWCAIIGQNRVIINPILLMGVGESGRLPEKSIE
jgi:hypothetical protein